MELLDFEDKEDISKGLDGSVMRKILKEGSAWESPKELAKVSVHYELRLPGASQPFYNSRDEAGGNPKSVVVDDGELLAGVDEGLQRMRVGEEAILYLKPSKAYGAAGNPQYGVPPDSPVECKIELVSLENPKSSYEMNTAEKLAAAEERRAQGNDFFKKGDMKRAAKRYRSALSLLDSDYGLSDEEKQQFKQCKLPCYLNLSQCALKQKEYGEARTQANHALEIDAENVKVGWGAWRAGETMQERITGLKAPPALFSVNLRGSTVEHPPTTNWVTGMWPRRI